MKRFVMSGLAALSLMTITSCNCASYQSPDVVRETYTHKYGLNVSRNDWKDRGSNGTVTTAYRNGVTVARNYEKGLLHGLTTYTYPHSNVVQVSEKYEKGQLLSKMTHYSSGLPSKEVVYVEPNHVKKTYWFEDGTPQRQEELVEGKLISGEYFTPSHECEARVVKGEGIRSLRDPSGHLICHDKIIDGELHEKITYYPNNDVETVTSYKNGVKEGERKTFAHGGEPLTVELWQADQQHGSTLTFQNGIKRSEATFVQGKKHGVEKLFDDYGQVAQEITWMDGYRHGPTRLFVDGIVKTEWYYRDNAVSKMQYDNPHHIH